MDIDLDKLVNDAKNLANVETIENDVSKEIINVAKQVFEINPEMNAWFRGVDILEELKDLGKTNVRNHLEKLVDKGVLEGMLFKTNKVYRLAVVTQDDE